MLRTCMLLCCLLTALLPAGIAGAEPDFELSLKELKKPALPPAAKKTTKADARKAAEAVKSKKKPRRKYRGEQTETAGAAPQPAVKVPSVAAPTTMKAAAPQPVVPAAVVEEVYLVPGLPCWLAGQVASVVAATVATDDILQGVKLAPVAIARHEGVTTVITCGLPAAESYTLGRLLESLQVQLLNLEGTESSPDVIERVIGSLGFSYAVEGKGKDRQFLVSLESEPETMLRLIIKP